MSDQLAQTELQQQQHKEAEASIQEIKEESVAEEKDKAEAAEAAKVEDAEDAEDAEDSDASEGPKPWYVWFCRGLTAFIVIGGIIVVIVRRDITRAILEWFVNWLSEHRWLGPIALFFIYVVAQACMIPCIALVLGAGYGLMKAYDSFWQAMTIATFACWLGMWVGSVPGMLFARYLFRKTATRLAKKHKWISAFDMAMDTDGVKFLIIMRCCPLIPFAIQNYIMGATCMKMRHFIMTGVFMVPWTAMMVFYGTTLSNIHDAITGNYKTGPVGFVAMVGGALAAIIASIFLSIIVKRHMNKMVQDAEIAKEQAKKEKAKADKNANPQTGSQIELEQLIIPNPEVEHQKQPDQASQPAVDQRSQWLKPQTNLNDEI